MSYRIILGLALLAGAGGVATTPLSAQGRLTAGITGGTLGIGPELAYRFSDIIGFRGNASLLTVHVDVSSDDLDYDGRVRLKSAGAMIDVFPFGGGFRISGGARLNRNRARVTAMPSGATQVGTMVYTPAQIGTVSGTASVKDIAPALTLGWAGQNRSGFILGIEAGALFQGRTRLSRLTSSTGLIRQADLDAERAEIQDEVDKYKIYPIVQLTAGYRF